MHIKCTHPSMSVILHGRWLKSIMDQKNDRHVLKNVSRKGINISFSKPRLPSMAKYILCHTVEVQFHIQNWNGMLPYPPFEVAKFMGLSTPEIYTRAIDSQFHGEIMSSNLSRRLVLLLKSEQSPMASSRTRYCSSAYFKVSSRQP